MNGKYRVIRLISVVHAWLYRATGGRLGASLGPPALLLTTTGRRSGRTRSTPLFYLEHAGGWAVAASNAGMTFEPAWWVNLKHEPRAKARVGRDEVPVRAREANPEERNELWPRFVAMYSDYESYRRTAGREIPVVILERSREPALPRDGTDG